MRQQQEHLRLAMQKQLLHIRHKRVQEQVRHNIVRWRSCRKPLRSKQSRKSKTTSSLGLPQRVRKERGPLQSCAPQPGLLVLPELESNSTSQLI